MISIYDKDTLRAALARDLNIQLRAAINTHLDRATNNGLRDLTYLLVVEPTDTDAAIEQEMGFSPLVCPFDGHHWRDARFAPQWAWLDHQPGWYELIITVANSGFAYILLTADDANTTSDLASMCRHHYAISGNAAG
jgi:hypothetical protein